MSSKPVSGWLYAIPYSYRWAVAFQVFPFLVWTSTGAFTCQLMPSSVMEDLSCAISVTGAVNVQDAVHHGPQMRVSLNAVTPVNQTPEATIHAEKALKTTRRSSRVRISPRRHMPRRSFTFRILFGARLLRYLVGGSSGDVDNTMRCDNCGAQVVTHYSFQLSAIENLCTYHEAISYEYVETCA